MVAGTAIAISVSAGLFFALPVAFFFGSMALFFLTAGGSFFLFPVSFMIAGVAKAVVALGFALAGLGIGAWGISQLKGGRGSPRGPSGGGVVDVETMAGAPDEEEEERKRREDELRDFDDLLNARDRFRNGSY